MLRIGAEWYENGHRSLTNVARVDLKAAVVGAGLMGRVHAHAALHAGARLVGIADVDQARAGELARETNSSVLSLDELMTDRRADVIHVCAPPEEHFFLCRRALESAINVLCEKPLAPDAAQTAALLGLARAKGLLLCPMHQFPFQGGVRRAREAQLGNIVHIASEMCTAGASSDAEGARRIALDILTHPLTLFRAFGISALARIDWKVSTAGAGEIVVSGASGAVALSVLISARGRPTSNVLRVIGDRATASIDLFHGFAVIEDGEVSRFRKAARPFAASLQTLGEAAANGLRRAISGETSFPGLKSLVGACYSAVSSGGASPISPEEISDIASARDRIIALAGSVT